MIVPSETDEHDQAILEDLIHDPHAIVNGYVFIASWVDGEGQQRWRCYTNCDIPVSSVIGLLEMAKLDILGRSDTGMPFAYGEDEG